MTSAEYKTALALDIANQNVNLLINALAEARAEIDALKQPAVASMVDTRTKTPCTS
jgi:hypothetical protein